MPTFRARNFHWDLKIEPSRVIEYISQVVAWLRVCMLEDPSDGFNGAECYGNKVLLFDSLSENWGVEEEMGFQVRISSMCWRQDVMQIWNQRNTERRIISFGGC